MIKFVISITSLVLILAITTSNTLAQDADPEQVQTQSQTPEDPYGRGTPRGSIIGFLEAASDLDFELAVRYVDLRNLPGNIAALPETELARQLSFVLSRTVWLDDYSIDDTADGLAGDDLPEYRDELVTIETSAGEVVLYMQHVPRSDGEMIWKVSNRSMALVPQLYDEFGYPQWVESIRSHIPEGALLGLEFFKWIILLGIGLLAWPFLHVIALALTRVFSRPERPSYPLVKKVMTRPVVALAILLVMEQALNRLGAAAVAQKIMEAKTLLIIVAVWVCWSIINLFKDFQRDRLIAGGRPGAAQLLTPMATLVKLLILIAGVLFWMANLGLNISTVLAGLGVGGLALALALQKPLEDLMGALTMYSQAPVRVGDFCRYGNFTGSVEEIGLRTTRIRTLANTVVSIPNSRIAFVEIENYSARKKVHYKPILRLRYDTTPEQIQDVLDRLQAMLKNNPKVLEEPQRVRFTDFDTDAILIKVHAYIDTDNIADFLEISEQINIEVMQAVHASGAAFALPGRSIVMEEKTSPHPA
jgi:MscS family membrane protein